ncbi:hypothetical protein BKA56DRAFT_607209 [Ilyonectria sp. MPI-CAGE-AT-0026]|nr:hypothetical protein BKA56DRAFT_607209 [Ilyonectria sp. MPI-CAGE-AT-0026]
MEDNASGYAMESVDGSFAERGHLNIREMASCRTISTATQPVYEASGGAKQCKSYFQDHGGLGGKREGIGRILIGRLVEWFKLAEALATAGLVSRLGTMTGAYGTSGAAGHSDPTLTEHGNPEAQAGSRTGGQAENQPDRAGQHARLVMLEAVRTSATYLDVEHSTTDRLGRGGMRVIGYQRRGWELGAGQTHAAQSPATVKNPFNPARGCKDQGDTGRLSTDGVGRIPSWCSRWWRDQPARLPNGMADPKRQDEQSCAREDGKIVVVEEHDDEGGADNSHQATIASAQQHRRGYVPPARGWSCPELSDFLEHLRLRLGFSSSGPVAVEPSRIYDRPNPGYGLLTHQSGRYSIDGGVSGSFQPDYAELPIFTHTNQEYLWVKIYQPSCQVASRLHPRRFLNGENVADLGIHDLPRRINGFSLVVPRVC